MANKRTREQLRAIFARLRDKTRTKIGARPDFNERNPVMSGYLAGGAAAAGASLLALPWLGPKLYFMTKRHERHGIRALREMAKTSKLIKKSYPELKNVRRQYNVMPFSSAYDPMSNTVRLGPEANEAITAHEFGHARTYLKNPRFGKFLRISRRTAPSMVLPSVLAQPVISRSKMSKENKRRARIAAALAPAGVFSPVLLDEALASGRAVGMMKRIGVKKVYRKAAKDLVPAFGTYVAAGAAGSAFPVVTARGYRKRDKRNLGKIKARQMY